MNRKDKIYNYEEYMNNSNREGKYGYYTNDKIQTIYLLVKFRIKLYTNFKNRLDLADSIEKKETLVNDIQSYQDIFNLSGYFYKVDNICGDKTSSGNENNLLDIIRLNSLYITFEFFSEKMIRYEQYKILRAMFSDLCIDVYDNKIYQLIMGAGKSSVIIPLCCLILNNHLGYIPITILPSHLVNQMDMSLSVLRNFGITIDSNSLQINRDVELFDFDLEDIIRPNKVYICSDPYQKES